MNQLKIGLALGSGGARGFAHLGIIKVLEEAGIKIDYIAGSSMGALVGAMYACGGDINRLIQLSCYFQRKTFMDWTVSKMGLISGERVYQLIRLMTKNMTFDQTKIPLQVIATDLQAGEKVVLDQGSIAEAVRASISIPGVFVPVEREGRLLVDGGVIDRIPVSTAKEMGADFTIAVDVSHVQTNVKMTSLIDVFMQSLDILQDEIVHHRKVLADFMIRPHVEQFSGYAFTNIDEIIAIGEQEARLQLPRIQQKLHEYEQIRLGK